jgi:hypothetical protein
MTILQTLDEAAGHLAGDRVLFSVEREELAVFVVEARAAVAELVEALSGLPDDVDMVDCNPEEPQAFFCCGARTSINHGRMTHAQGCWYSKTRAALAKFGGEK